MSVGALRERLGHDGMAGFYTVIDEKIDETGHQWKGDVLAVAGERFERRLAEEIGALRVDMAKEFAALRVEMARESTETRTSLLKWSFLFWIGQFAAVSAMMAFLLRTIGPR
jgi:hypothetical protein